MTRDGDTTLSLVMFQFISKLKKEYMMMKTNASIRRFLYQQKLNQRDAPTKLVERYECYVWCVAKDEHPKTWREWVAE